MHPVNPSLQSGVHRSELAMVLFVFYIYIYIYILYIIYYIYKFLEKTITYCMHFSQRISKYAVVEIFAIKNQ